MLFQPLFWTYLFSLFLIFIFLTNRISFHPPREWGEVFWTFSWCSSFLLVQTAFSLICLRNWNFTWPGLSVLPISSLIYLSFVASWVVWMVLDHVFWKFIRLQSLQVKKIKIVKIKSNPRFVPPFGFLKKMGIENQLYQPQLVEYEVKLEGLPKEWSGLTIVQISDLHYGKFFPVEYYEPIFQQAKGLKPDLFAFTGDFINSKKDIPAIKGLLKGFKAPLGVYAVLGNHDHGAGPEALTRALTQAGIRVLDNEVVYYRRKGKSLAIMGAAELWHGHRNRSAILNAKADAKLFLAHHPDHYFLGKKSGAHLQISGHAHGGQIRFPFLGPLIVPSNQGRKYAQGFYREKNTVLFVTNGIGCYPPLRTLCPPEMVKLVLKPA
jgi:predicted MPP superfamily phosphohydrolase